MNLTSLIDGVRGLLTAQTAKQIETFQSLVVRVADGKAVKPAEVLAVLTAAGKTPEDLQADVEALLVRRERHARYLRLPAINADVQAATADLTKANAEWEAFLKRHQQIGAELEWKLRELTKEQTQTQALRDGLAQTCTCPVLLAKKAELEARRVELLKQRQEASSVAGRHFSQDPDRWAKTAGIIHEQPRPDDWSPLTHSRAPDPRAMSPFLAENQRLVNEVQRLDAELRGTEAAVERLLDEMANFTV